jgi:hypothetical protein
MNEMRKYMQLVENAGQPNRQATITDFVTNELLQTIAENLPDQRMYVTLGYVTGHARVKVSALKEPNTVRASFILDFRADTESAGDDGGGIAMSKRVVPHLSFNEMIAVVKGATLPDNVRLRKVALYDERDRETHDAENQMYNPNGKALHVVVDISQ